MPPRYSRNRHPLWLRLQMLQIWINERMYLAGHKMRKLWWRLPFNRGRLRQKFRHDPAHTPRLLASPLFFAILVFAVLLLLVFGEGLLNTRQIVGMMTGVDTNQLDLEE